MGSDWRLDQIDEALTRGGGWWYARHADGRTDDRLYEKVTVAQARVDELNGCEPARYDISIPVDARLLVVQEARDDELTVMLQVDAALASLNDAEAAARVVDATAARWRLR